MKLLLSRFYVTSKPTPNNTILYYDYIVTKNIIYINKIFNFIMQDCYLILIGHEINLSSGIKKYNIKIPNINLLKI